MCMSSLQNQRYYFLKRKVVLSAKRQSRHEVSVAVELAHMAQTPGQHEHLSFPLSSSIEWEQLERAVEIE